MTTDGEAITVIARDLLASLLGEHGGTAWEDYPDLGEHDWNRVVTRARRFADRPDPGTFKAAYDHLAAQADSEGP